MKLKELVRKDCDDFVSICGLGDEMFKITLVGSEKDLIDVEIGNGDNTKILESSESELKGLMVDIGRFLEKINKEVN